MGLSGGRSSDRNEMKRGKVAESGKITSKQLRIGRGKCDFDRASERMVTKMIMPLPKEGPHTLTS